MPIEAPRPSQEFVSTSAQHGDLSRDIAISRNSNDRLIAGGIAGTLAVGLLAASSVRAQENPDGVNVDPCASASPSASLVLESPSGSPFDVLPSASPFHENPDGSLDVFVSPSIPAGGDIVGGEPNGQTVSEALNPLPATGEEALAMFNEEIKVTKISTLKKKINALYENELCARFLENLKLPDEDDEIFAKQQIDGGYKAIANKNIPAGKSVFAANLTALFLFIYESPSTPMELKTLILEAGNASSDLSKTTLLPYGNSESEKKLRAKKQAEIDKQVIAVLGGHRKSQEEFDANQS